MTKKISLILIILSLFLILYVFYKAEVVFSGNKSNYYLIYYIVSILFLFLSIILYFLKNDLREKLILILFSVIFSLYCVEIYFTFKLKFFVNNQKNIINFNLVSKDVQGRSKIDLYEEYKDNKIKTNIYVPPVKLINFSKSILPLSSISNTKKISCNENGYFPVYQSDRYGFNNPDIEWNKDNIEYLLVGDSFAHGDCVNADDNLAAQFRNLINSDFSVISLGHSGNGPLFEFATLREYLPSNKTVKNVIWLYYEANDLSNLNKEKKNNILFNYLKNPKFSQNLKDKQMKINTLIENFFLQEYKFYNQNNLIKNNKNNNQIIHFFKFQEIRKNILDNYFGGIDSDFSRILSFSDQLVKENNSQLYFVYIPEYFRFKKDAEIQSSSKKYKRIIKIVKKLNIPIIDLKEKISKEEKPLSFFSVNGVHFNEEGYKFAAEKIFEKIKR